MLLRTRLRQIDLGLVFTNDTKNQRENNCQNKKLKFICTYIHTSTPVFIAHLSTTPTSTWRTRTRSSSQAARDQGGMQRRARRREQKEALLSSRYRRTSQNPQAPEDRKASPS